MESMQENSPRNLLVTEEFMRSTLESIVALHLYKMNSVNSNSLLINQSLKLPCHMAKALCQRFDI
jgi:hypothetical protein